ncbi:P-type conjugative transfer ATPase TrbB [Phenylobacterium sp.]|jgi:type IV secretion system protein VirB11|uniref:P-type conjugative transfer ATPase TrbB n=1 Tax=Phenylobacterium sp. TaxID=1871053 RepID=UPI002E34360C|nr:P-type conjugative transfer ATPase TrbB [Phenylobacterium sp.]HEX2562231.1 P-type conjugative transfer ATPase TrbB [Phenylobacterium sp.]
MSRAGEHPIAAERRLEALRHALGQAALDALHDPDVVEIMANPDGRIVLDRLGSGRSDTGERSSPEARERVVRLIADYMGEEVRREDPRVSGVLPTTGERFQGFLPPVTAAAAYSIRKRPPVIYGLASYVAMGALTPEGADRLRLAALRRENLLISGGTSSGKTTLANAILAEPAFAQDRVFLVEDVPELQCSAWDSVACLTRRQPKPVTVADLVRDALRMRPDRIVVGELRDGAAALETLKAWNTGHPGGLSTIHANSAAEALVRFEDLVAEVAVRPPRRALGQALRLVAHIARSDAGRRIDLLEVRPEGGDYRVEPSQS